MSDFGLLWRQVFGALAEYAFILRQIIHVSRSKSKEEAADLSLSAGVGSPTLAVATGGGSGAPAVVAVSYPSAAAEEVGLVDEEGKVKGPGGIAFKLNGGMEMRAAAAAAAAAAARNGGGEGLPEEAEETSTFIRQISKVGGACDEEREEADPRRAPSPVVACVSGTSPRHRNPLVAAALRAEYSSEACLGAPHGAHHRHLHTVHDVAGGKHGHHQNNGQHQRGSQQQPTSMVVLVRGPLF